MKKILSLVLASLIIFATIPVAFVGVLADVTLPSVYGGDDEFAALVGTNSSITLDKDYVLTKPISTSLSTITANGYTITYNPSKEYESATAITSTKALTLNVGTDKSEYEKNVGSFVNLGTGYFFKSSEVTMQGKGSYGDGKTYGDIYVDGNLKLKTNSTYYHYGNVFVTGKTFLNGDKTSFYGNVTTKDFYFERVVEIKGYLHTTGNDVNLGKCNPYSGHCQTIYFTGTDTYNGYTIYCEGNATYNFDTEKITLNTTNGRNILNKDIYVGGDLSVTWFGHTELGFTGKVVVDGELLVTNYKTKRASNHPDVTAPKNITFSDLTCTNQSLQLTENYHNSQLENQVSVYDSGSAVTVTPYAVLENIIQVKLDGEVLYSGKVQGATIVLPENDNVEGYLGDVLYEPASQVTFDKTTNLITIIGSIKDSDFQIDTTDKIYTSKEITTDITTDFVLGKDYEVNYSDNVNVGEVTVTITGIGNYYGTVTASFNIINKQLSDSDFEFDLADKVYTGSEFTPVVTSLIPQSQYDVIYTNNLNAGVASITVKGKNNCTGEITKNFNILPKEIAPTDFQIDTTDKTYTATAITPQISSDLEPSKDYEVLYEDNIEIGTAKITITGVGNYTGVVKTSFEIVKISLTEDMFVFDLDKERIYSGKEFDDAIVSTKLVKDVDYTLEYKDNLNVGTATLKITGIGNYQGTFTKTFKISPASAQESAFAFELSDKVYTGEKITPQVTSTLELNKDYTLEYKNNLNVGTATIVVTLIGNYTGKIEKTFSILPQTISDADFEIDLTDKVYTRKQIKPEITSELVLGTDYSVLYTNNTNVGTAEIIITGLGNYSGQVAYAFEITPDTLTPDMFSVDATVSYIYDGTAKELPYVSLLIPDVDYTVAYENNVNAGTAALVFTGCGNYQGEVRYEFKIAPRTLTKNNFILEFKQATYTGKAIKPALAYAPVVVGGVLTSKDIAITYKNNTRVGTATITVKAKGNYAGTFSYTFKIVKPTVKRTAKITLAGGAKKITVKYKKVSKADGYVIQYSLKKNFKGKKTVYVSKKYAKKVLKKLKSGKKYYVRVAAYRKYKKTGSSKTYKAIGKFRTKSVKVK